MLACLTDTPPPPSSGWTTDMPVLTLPPVLSHRLNKKYLSSPSDVAVPIKKRGWKRDATSTTTSSSVTYDDSGRQGMRVLIDADGLRVKEDRPPPARSSPPASIRIEYNNLPQRLRRHLAPHIKAQRVDGVLVFDDLSDAHHVKGRDEFYFHDSKVAALVAVAGTMDPRVWSETPGVWIARLCECIDTVIKWCEAH